MHALIVFVGRKKDTYDRYGKDGLKGRVFSPSTWQWQSPTPEPFPRHRPRDPFEVFREFFGGRDPFADFFKDGKSWTRDYLFIYLLFFIIYFILFSMAPKVLSPRGLKNSEKNRTCLE